MCAMLLKISVSFRVLFCFLKFKQPKETFKFNLSSKTSLNNGQTLSAWFLFVLLLASGCLLERFNMMLYLWCVIIYLFDYFVNYLSIELLILLHDFSLHYSWLNLRLLHQDAALLQCWVAFSHQVRQGY